MANAEATTAHKNWKQLDQSAYIRSYEDIPQSYLARLTHYRSLADVQSDWDFPFDKAIWLSSAQVEKNIDFKVLSIKDNIEIKIPISLVKDLELTIRESAYILDLKDNWDGEGSKAYSTETWVAAVEFTINFYKWISKIYSGKFYTPKIYHGPSESIDIVWSKDNFRLFINFDFMKNSGSFYSDRAKSQSTEGQIPSLQNIDFQLITPPIQL